MGQKEDTNYFKFRVEKDDQVHASIKKKKQRRLSAQGSDFTLKISSPVHETENTIGNKNSKNDFMQKVS